MPAVRRGLSGLSTLRVGSTISANGSAVGLSLVSMRPPGLPSSTSAARTVGVSAANPGQRREEPAEPTLVVERGLRCANALVGISVRHGSPSGVN